MIGFMVTTGIALAVASGSFFTTEMFKFRGDMVRNLSMLTQVIGTNCAASILFDDQATAEEVLSALASQRHILGAAVYRDGRLFASWRAPGSDEMAFPKTARPGHSFTEGYLDLAEPIVHEGEELGMALVRSNTSELAEFTERFALIVLGVCLAAFLICYVGASRLRREIIGPLQALVTGSTQMAGGNLSVQVQIDGEDEFSELAASFNAMASSLRGLISQVDHNTRAVAVVNDTLQLAGETLHEQGGRQDRAVIGTSESIERISESIRRVNDNAETVSANASSTAEVASQLDHSSALMVAQMDDLSENVEATSSTVVQMTTAIREIARGAEDLHEATEITTQALGFLSRAVTEVDDNARQTQSLSERTSKEAEEGASSVQKTVRGIEQIHTRFQGLEAIIEDLSLRSASIGEVIKVIEEVVEKANLLALNAAIIAAQAGDHGRSFAVVASEVQNLAQRTSGSASEISSQIKSVQTGIADAVEAMAEGRRFVEDGLRLATNAGSRLGTIGESARDSAARVSEIVEAAAGQAQDIDKVEVAMSKLRDIATQVKRATQEQSHATEGITRGVAGMSELAKDVKMAAQSQRKECARINTLVETVANEIKQIHEATQDQRAQGDQIIEALHIFREVSRQNAESRCEMEGSLKELSEHSAQLAQEVGRFDL